MRSGVSFLNHVFLRRLACMLFSAAVYLSGETESRRLFEQGSSARSQNATQTIATGRAES